jgi:peptide/nickel transport system ATP-binding protein
MSLLTIRNLSLAIHGKAVLKDISLHVDPGEVLAITGESGSGKSLTALAVMQLLPHGSNLSGQITLGPDELTALTEAELCKRRGNAVGMVFQEPMTALNPVQTIGAQVAETIRIHGGTDAQAARIQAAAMLTRVGLPQDRFPLDRYPHELSGGQRQRVVIAIAIAQRPDLLIADEPTTALDVTTQAQILALLTDLAREFRMGLILITHDLAVVADMADRIAVMQNGEIVETGPTQHLLRHMQHPYTRKLFEASTHQVDLPAPPEAQPLLDVDKVVCRYRLPRRNLFAAPGHFEAVRGVSFRLDKGERLGLVGESGCGKSTLTRALLGLEPVTSGRITLNGETVFSQGASLRALRRRMQVVFQDPFGSFNPRHRVSRLVTEPFHLLDTPPSGEARAQAVVRALTDVGLKADDQHRYIHEFSGGQRQRIAIARALIIRPELILFDEAVSALDVSVRAQILDLLADLCRAYGLAYLFISHDLHVVRSVTDRVMVMQAGEIVESGRTETVFANPRHAYTKRLLSATPRLPELHGL